MLAPGLGGLRNLGARVLALRRRRPRQPGGPAADPAEVERVVYEQIYGDPRRYIDNIRPVEPPPTTKTRPRRASRNR
jgi:hypothetical protein